MILHILKFVAIGYISVATFIFTLALIMVIDKGIKKKG